MAQLPGVLVDPQGQTISVTILSKPSGATPTVYADPLAMTARTMPATITSPTVFFLPSEGQYSVNGRTFTVESAQVATVSIPLAAFSPFTPMPIGPNQPPYNTGIYAIRGLDLASVMGHVEDPTFVIKAALRRGFEFVWISDIYKALVGNGSLPEKPILLSYDDGRSQLWSVVKPVIDTFGIKCNAFITSDFTDGNPDGLVDASLSGFAPGATWANLQTMKATGLWEFHNHTRIHAQLPTQTAGAQISDLLVCNAAVLANLGQTPLAVAYPNHADERHRRRAVDRVRLQRRR